MGIREGFVLMEGRGSKINHAYVDGFSGFDRRREDRGREQEAWHVSCAPDRKRKGEVDPYVFSTFFARARALILASPLFVLLLAVSSSSFVS